MAGCLKGAFICGGESATRKILGSLLIILVVSHTVSAELTPCDDLQKVPRAHRSPVTQVALTEDGDLISGAVDGSLKVWRTANGERRKVLRTHAGGVEGLSLNVAQDQIVSVSMTGLIRTWHLPTGEQLTESSVPSAHSVVFVGNQLLAATTAGLWFADADYPTNRWKKLATQPIVSMAALSDERAVTWECDGTARRWSLSAMKEVADSKQFEGMTTTASTTNGQLAIAAEGSIRILDGKTFQVHSSFDATDVSLLAITPDGQTIAAIRDQTLWLASATGKTQEIFDLPSPITAIAASSKLLAVGDARGVLTLIQIGTAEMIGVVHDEPFVLPEEMAKRREQTKATQALRDEEQRKARAGFREHRKQREAAEAARRAELSRQRTVAQQEWQREQQQRFQQWQNPFGIPASQPSPSGNLFSRPTFNGVPLPYGGSVCSRCGRSVSYGSSSGQRCPFCGAVWSGVKKY